MPTPPEFFRWWIVDERTGRRWLTTRERTRVDEAHPWKVDGKLPALLLVAGILGCGPRLSPEEQCLQSDRLAFKDPDSLRVVANLGDRGRQSEGNGTFWIRYSATNSYGARTSANMACSSTSDGRWLRSADVEARAVNEAFLASMDTQVQAMEEQNKKARDCKDSKCTAALLGPIRSPETAAADAEKRANNFARERVYESAEPLRRP